MIRDYEKPNYPPGGEDQLRKAVGKDFCVSQKVWSFRFFAQLNRIGIAYGPPVATRLPGG